MKMKKYLILALVSFSILIVLWPGRRITGETGLSAKEKENDSNLPAREKSALSAKGVLADEKEILRGLEGVYVVVESIGPKAEEYGLRRQALQTDTELLLRQYGIKVLTFEERLSTPGGPCLYINVNVLIEEDLPLVAAAIRVELQEYVLLLREPKRICFGASIWSRDEVVRVGLLKIKKLKESVKDHVNEFINDYLVANPTKKPTVSPSTTKPPRKGS